VHLRRTLTSVAVATALLIAGVAVGVPAAAVADGWYATNGQYPFATKLTMTHIPRSDGSFYDSACSAALISPTWIVTAGHCFHDVNRNPVSGPVPYPTTATLNTADLSTRAGEVRSVTFVRQAATADIALAQLSAPVTDVAPLPVSAAKPLAGQLLTIAGWGATSSTNPTPSTRLTLGQVKVKTVKASTLGVVGYFPAKDTSACLYDSGAPYFSTASGKVALVSVESDGPACPHITAETTYRVDPLVGWMRSTATDMP
jgi:secreted trypsin-like serine protease